MKIGIIGSSIADLSICSLLCLYDARFHIVLDTRFGAWGNLSWEDSLERLDFALDVLGDCDYIILPPIYELYAKSKIQNSKFKILPLFQAYVEQSILPCSIVGKIGLIGYENHQHALDIYWSQIIKNYSLNTKQLSNKHFQSKFPLYKVKTNHRSICFDLQKSRLINKLIKMDLRKLKDYAIDTLLPLEWGYLQLEKPIKQAFHSKIRRQWER